MAQIKENTTIYTNSSLIVRYESGFGLLVYSPFTGLIYAVYENDIDEVLNWLDKKNVKIKEEYENTLGYGWKKSLKEFNHQIPHLLPNSKSFPSIISTKYPILINWLITGKCMFACKYCYAEDLMRNEKIEPSENEIEKIAKTILKYNPLVVVLSGGEPLLSPYFEKAVKFLYKKTGIIVDTNAINLNKYYLNLIKEYGISVRISFDSEIPKINQKQRPYFKGFNKLHNNYNKYTLIPTIKVLCDCIKEGISVSIQSVATKKTANDLLAMGDKLYKLGLHSWRVHEIQPSQCNLKGYKELVGSKNQQKKLYKHIFNELKKLHNDKWKKQVALQIIENETPNAVILVSPDGKFYTESNIRPGKILIDEDNPFNPRLKLINKTVNIHAHAERYLNISKKS